jgi:hypothetical protein
MLNKCILTIEGNNHRQNKIKAINDYHIQIHDFVVVDTHATILPLRVIVTYATILNSSLPTDWSNENHWLSW